MGPVGFEPTTKRLCIPLQLSLPEYCPVCGLDCPFVHAGISYTGRLPSSLYTFPGDGAWLGITVSCELGFPEFDRSHLKITLQAAR